jgi:uncharacterized protein
MMRWSVAAPGLAAAAALAACGSLAMNEAAACAAVPQVALKGRLTDDADMLQPADEASIRAAILDYEQHTNRQLVVATIERAGDVALEDWGKCLGNRWGVGDKERDDGVVLLLFERERKTRLSAGSGIERALTDADAQLIVETMSPFFGRRDFAGGLDVGLKMIAAETGAVAEK